MKWTLEQFKEAMSKGREIAPKTTRGHLRGPSDTACALGALLLGAGYDVLNVDRTDSSKNNESLINNFMERTGLKDSDIIELTLANDNSVRRTDEQNADHVVLSYIANLIKGENHD